MIHDGRQHKAVRQLLRGIYMDIEEVIEKEQEQPAEGQETAEKPLADVVGELRAEYEAKLAAQASDFAAKIKERDDVIKQILTAPAEEEKAETVADKLNKKPVRTFNKIW